MISEAETVQKALFYSRRVKYYFITYLLGVISWNDFLDDCKKVETDYWQSLEREAKSNAKH